MTSWKWKRYIFFGVRDGQDIIEDAYGNETLIIESKYSDLIFIKQDQQLKINYSNSKGMTSLTTIEKNAKEYQEILNQFWAK
ncbi:hypothetical protein [Carnobacterium divergens]|uniref:hypothetical protein n=1 Tax=Carnobacterium divergens TaxID=2748 RepID=UPI00128DEE95|nr:hypothetical protein [Carnobacterium divergens]MPQ21885.1 hypothetical protein [Carnobacterium divergens]